MVGMSNASSGSDSLSGLVSKLREAGGQYRDEPEMWRDYVSQVETLDKIQAAVPALVGDVDSLGQSFATIEDKGDEKVSAVQFCNDRIATVIGDVQDALTKFDTGNGILGRALPSIGRYTKREGFALGKDDISRRINRASNTIRMIRIAIGLAALAESKLVATVDQADSLRKIMQEQLAPFRHVRGEIRSDDQEAPLATNGQSPQAGSPTASSPLDLQRLSLASHSSWGTEILGDDLSEPDSSTAPQPPMPSDISYEALRPEANVESSDHVLLHETDPNETQAGQEHAEDGKKEDGPSEHERSTDPPKSAISSAAKPDPAESALQLPVRSQVDIFFSCALVVGQCKPGSSLDVLFCIDRIVDDGDGQVFVVREPCHDRPCHHSFVRGLKTWNLPVRLPNRRTYVVTRIKESSEENCRDVAPNGGAYLTVGPKCSASCRHTIVEVHGPGDPDCILPTCFEASVAPSALKLGTPNQDSTIPPVSRTCHDNLSGLGQTGGESVGDLALHQTEAEGPHQQEGQGERGLGPFSAVPCVFCGKDATTPQLESPTTLNATLDTSAPYSYRCSLCGGKNWFTALGWGLD